MKKLLLLNALILFVSVSAFAQVKVGYMNPNEVLSQLPEVASIDQQIQTLVDQRDQELIDKATKLQQDFTSYEQQRSQLTPDQQTAQENDLLARNQELEQERETYLNEIRQRRATLMEPITARLNAAIEAVAQSMDLDLVLNESTVYGDAIVFYAGNERLNITSKVLEKLTSQ